MACTSEKREVEGCMKDAKTLSGTGSRAIIAIAALGAIAALIAASAATVAQTLA